MKKIVSFQVLENYRVRLQFDDGANGEADFSADAGKGVFAPWSDYGFFRQARIGDHGRSLTWPGELDFCADALWLQVTCKTPEELWENWQRAQTRQPLIPVAPLE
jgi:hypothetical protein